MKVGELVQLLNQWNHEFEVVVEIHGKALKDANVLTIRSGRGVRQAYGTVMIVVDK